MYQVTVHHHDKDIVRGDLEDKFELIDSKLFKTKKAAKDWIESKMAVRPGVKFKDWGTADKPGYSRLYTGVTWQHENSGEEMEEYYQYKLEKVKLR